MEKRVNIPLSKVYMDADIKKVVMEVLDGGWYILGEKVREFEQMFADFCGVKHAVCVSSGTAAIFLTLKALDVGPGDEVITCANTFVATLGAIVATGAKPVLVDSENGFTPERFIQLFNKQALKNIHIYKPKSFEEQLKTIRVIEKETNEETGLIIVDSAVSLYRLILHNDVQEANYKLTLMFHILAKISSSKKIPVFVTNQVYADFDTGDIELVGRDIPKYFSKTIIKLEKTGDNRRICTLIKHRFMPEGAKINFEIKSNGLFDIKKFKLF